MRTYTFDPLDGPLDPDELRGYDECPCEDFDESDRCLGCGRLYEES